jgi:hypothetical protein
MIDRREHLVRQKVARDLHFLLVGGGEEQVHANIREWGCQAQRSGFPFYLYRVYVAASLSLD